MDDDDTKGFSDAPPSYDDSIQHPDGSTSPQDASGLGSGSGSEPATWHLQNHIASLPSRIRTSQRARTAQQKLDDTLLVNHIAPAIEEFLIDLGAQGGAATPLATLTIVPDRAVPLNAELSGLSEMRRRGELCRVSRISVKDGNEQEGLAEKGGKDSSPAFTKFTFASDASSPFCAPDYDAADLLWWRDEAMARRLAGCLQPKAAATGKKPQAERHTCTSAVQGAVEKQKRGWGWGKWRNGRGSPPGGAETHAAGSAAEAILNSRPQQQEQKQKAPETRGQDRAHMIVEAQEVAFRVENDLGILESIRGWGIVVTVDVG